MFKQIIGWFRKEPSRKPNYEVFTPVPETFTVTLDTRHLMALLEASTSEYAGNTYSRGGALLYSLQQDENFAWSIVEQLAEQGFTCLQDDNAAIVDIESSEWRA